MFELRSCHQNPFVTVHPIPTRNKAPVGLALKLCAGIFTCSLLGIVGAQSVSDQASTGQIPVVQEFSPVLVQGLGNPAALSYANLLKGVTAYMANRQLAPQAPLLFRVHDRTTSSTPLTLRLEAGDKIVPIEVTTERLFRLPSAGEVGATDGELVANRRAGSLTLGVHIQSPGFDSEYRRLGDHRLWCEVFTVINEDDASPLLRLKVLLNGGWCKSSRLRLFQPQPWKATVTGVEMSEGDRRIAGMIHADKNSFYVPVHDLTWSNEATFRLTFGPAQPAPPAFETKRDGS